MKLVGAGPAYLVSAVVSMVVLGILCIWIEETETRLGFSSHWIPWFIVYVGWIVTVPLLLIVAARINYRNGLPAGASLCALGAVLVFFGGAFVPDWFLFRVVSIWLSRQ